jgi:hypothetical protein
VANQNVDGLNDTWLNIHFTNFLRGGAFTLSNATLLRLENCAFISCGLLDAGGMGGAIWGGSFLSFVVQQTLFTGCFADWGGAVYLETPVLQVSFDTCNFTNNTGLNGAAVYFARGSPDAAFVSTTFWQCIARGNGTIYFTGEFPSKLTVDGCDFSENGGSQAWAIVVLDSDALSLSGTNLTNNYATEGGGGALSLFGVADAEIDKCRFVFNRTMYSETISVVLGGDNKTNVRLSAVFFDTTDGMDGVPPAHVASTVEGHVKFFLPFCFDLSGRS